VVCNDALKCGFGYHVDEADEMMLPMPNSRRCRPARLFRLTRRWAGWTCGSLWMHGRRSSRPHSALLVAADLVKSRLLAKRAWVSYPVLWKRSPREMPSRRLRFLASPGILALRRCGFGRGDSPSASPVRFRVVSRANRRVADRRRFATSAKRHCYPGFTSVH
jgi:hypothetical protein